MNDNNTKFTALFIKPDAMRDGLAEVIVNDFAEAGFDFMYVKPVELTEEQATFVYKDHEGNPNFPFAIGSIMQEEDCRTSLFLIARYNEGEALAKAQEAKGRADGNGIRARYRRYHSTELTDRGIEGDERKSLLSRNRIHIPDTNEHACQIIEMIIEKDELNELKNLDREFKAFIEGHQSPHNPEIEGGGNGIERL